MNIWEVFIENKDWSLNPYQTIMVATNSLEISDAAKVASENFSGLVVRIKHIGFAHLPKGA